MVKHSEAVLDRTFAALADPTRRALLRQLARGPAPMGELQRPFGMSWPAITKHVKTLERAKLVRREQDGRLHRIHLVASPMQAARDWLDSYDMWQRRFDKLDALLKERP